MSVEKRVEELLSCLTLREKVSLLSGMDDWRTVAVGRCGIPSLCMTDGPHGVRTGQDPGRAHGSATSFPTGAAMAAGWNPALIGRVGEALAEETRALGCDILLGPCVNIVRHPLSGRNFESYSEDPYLAGRIGAAWIKGIQCGGIGSSVKHFACNNQETERSRGSSEVDERTLREIYLPAFETAVKEAEPWTVMCSYNRLNGVYASENEHLLREILKKEWGFDGFVVSDWGANHTVVESVAGGLDLEMPGPAKYYGRLLYDAVNNWQIDPAAIDEAVRRILRVIVKSGIMDKQGDRSAGCVNTPGHQALAREVAEESIVLLKNEGGLLPLSTEGLNSIAVIGPNADEDFLVSGGGSACLEPPYQVSPLAAFRSALGSSVSVAYEPGCENWVEPPVLKACYLEPSRGDGQGLWGEYFDGIKPLGGPSLARRDERFSNWWWSGKPDQSIEGREFSIVWTGRLIPPVTGRHIFRLINNGSCRLYLDGKLLVESVRRDGDAFTIHNEAEVYLTQGRPCDLRIEYGKPAAEDAAVVEVRYGSRPESDLRLQSAVELARRADAAVVCLGMPAGYESEGRDRPDMELPGRQNELARAVAAANPRTIVVLNCGSPVALPWIDEVPAVLLAHYPGMEGGRALARVLTGEVNPSGRLPVTWPKRLADTPAFTNYPGDRQVRYGEGIFVGYRWYDEHGIEPLFPFGHGLSYTGFSYGEINAPRKVSRGEPVRVSVKVRNNGGRSGKEVVQLYLADKESTLPRPPKELKGFVKIALEPGEEKEACFVLDERALSYYDPSRGGWVAEPGEFEILLGGSSRDIRARASLTLAR